MKLTHLYKRSCSLPSFRRFPFAFSSLKKQLFGTFGKRLLLIEFPDFFLRVLRLIFLYAKDAFYFYLLQWRVLPSGCVAQWTVTVLANFTLQSTMVADKALPKVVVDNGLAGNHARSKGLLAARAARAPIFVERPALWALHSVDGGVDRGVFGE